jgi:hypothetical protein
LTSKETDVESKNDVLAPTPEASDFSVVDSDGTDIPGTFSVEFETAGTQPSGWVTFLSDAPLQEGETYQNLVNAELSPYGGYTGGIFWKRARVP